MLKEVIGIFGLILIILGNITIYKSKPVRKNYTYPFLIAGGILLTFYSILIKDKIFTILQITFVLASIYGLIKLNQKMKKKK